MINLAMKEKADGLRGRILTSSGISLSVFLTVFMVTKVDEGNQEPTFFMSIY